MRSLSTMLHKSCIISKFQLLSVLLLFASSAQAQNTFYVDTWLDKDDYIPGDGICNTIFGDCTLRAAIEEANALANNGGPDEILFTNIPMLAGIAVITLQDTLPLIVDPIFIDATTADGEVIINGEQAGDVGSISGLALEAGSSGSTIRGLSIGNFSFRGIYVNSNDNVIEKNYVGVLRDGTDYGNAQGIMVGGNGNRIGGIGNVSTYSDLGKGNVVGFNGGNGISIYGDDNIIRRNFIGVDPSSQCVGNGSEGIFDTGDRNTIGGPLRRYGNRIGCNGDEGIHLFSNSSEAIVRNNFIGTDNEGNDLGNGANGIRLYYSSQHTIGGIKDRGNEIGFNENGIYMYGSGENTIQGNYIGVNRDGDEIGNDGAGIFMYYIDGTVENVFGYAADAVIPSHARKGNVIAYNGSHGIVMASAFSDQNPIRGNAIYDNEGLGIDLDDDGQTVNDSLDFDNGPNELQNYPDLVRAFYRAGSDEIAIEFSVSSGTNYASYPLTIDAYLADDPVSGEGKSYIGTLSYPTPDILARFEIPASTVDWAPEDVVVLTATDADGNSSEFSPPSGPLSDATTATQRFTDTLHLAAGDALQTQNMVTVSEPYPNPFNPQTTFTLAVPELTTTRITVHDLLGRQVGLLYNGELTAGTTHTFSFDGSNLTSGTYLLRIAGAGLIETHKLMLLK